MTKKKRSKPTPSQPSQPSQELLDKVSGLKQLINIHDLLNTGTFQGHLNKRVGEGIEMVTQLHKQLLEEVMNDADAHLVPGLLNSDK